MLIDTPTAWSILCTPLVIAAGLGWIRCSEKLQAALDLASTRQIDATVAKAERDEAYGILDHYGTELLVTNQNLAIVTAERDKCKLRAEQYASSWGRVMRLLRIAEGELKTFRTAQLRQEQAERMDAAADRIAA